MSSQNPREPTDPESWKRQAWRLPRTKILDADERDLHGQSIAKIRPEQQSVEYRERISTGLYWSIQLSKLSPCDTLFSLSFLENNSHVETFLPACDIDSRDERANRIKRHEASRSPRSVDRKNIRTTIDATRCHITSVPQNILRTNHYNLWW